MFPPEFASTQDLTKTSHQTWQFLGLKVSCVIALEFLDIYYYLLTDAYRPSHWDRSGWGSGEEDASLLSFWTQRHNSKQVRVGQRATQDER